MTRDIEERIFDALLNADFLRKTDEPIQVSTDIVQIVVQAQVGTALYASGDALGSRFVIPNVVSADGGSAVLESVVVIDKDDEGVQIDFPLFTRVFTATADNAAFAVSDVDLESCIGVVSVSNYSDFANNQIGTARGLGLAFTIPEGRDLHCQAVVRGAPTFGNATDLIFKFTFQRA